jgi:hypothetical protein
LHGTFTVHRYGDELRVPPLLVDASGLDVLLNSLNTLSRATFSELPKHVYFRLKEGGRYRLTENWDRFVSALRDGTLQANPAQLLLHFKEASPEGSPTKAVPGFFSGYDCPVIYSDPALELLTDRLVALAQGRVVDNRHVLMFAVPGSGKSTTVAQAAARSQARHLRSKLTEGGELDCSIWALCKGQLPRMVSFSAEEPFNACKTFFSQPCSKFVDSIEREILKDTSGRPVVVHVDEAQVVMGRTFVTREIPAELWLDDPTALRSFAFLTLCDALNGLGARHRNVLIVITGTNAFSSLALNLGSQLKVERIQLLGRFPVDWVMRNLVAPHFVLSPELEKAMWVQLESLCVNRRACWLFLRALWRNASAAGSLSVELIEASARAGCAEWGLHVKSSLGSDIGAVTRAWAVLEAPEAFGGKRVQSDGIQVVRFPGSHGAQEARELAMREVREFALAGGINVWLLPTGEMDIEVPAGCVRDLFAELVGPALHQFNLRQAQVFCEAANSNSFDIGHVFERLVAGDLTMLGTPLYARLVTHLAPLSTFAPDPLVFARPFEYKSRIAQSEWAQHRVYCVRDIQSDLDRFVDVGCPLVKCEANGDRAVRRVLLQLSSVASENDNWRKCAAFFARACEYPQDIFCFVSRHAFMGHVPKPKPAKKGASAADSRAEVLRLLQTERRMLVLDGPMLSSWFRLPLLLIMEQVMR